MTLAMSGNASPWIVCAILIPLTGAMLSFLWPRRASLTGLGTALAILVAAGGLCGTVLEHGPLRYAVGGWGAPLGIDLYADGLSALMVLMTAVVGAGVSVYAPAYFRRQARKAAAFWAFWLFLWAALNALFLSGDIFNLYITLELLGLAAVSLVAVAGGIDALTGAMRYLLVSLLGSLTYLLGVTLLYHAFGTVDIAMLGRLVEPTPYVWTAVSLMTAGLLLKTALFPLHFWLPAAHASAPAPVSALLSALVAKASFYVLLRLWLGVFPVGTALGQLLAMLGAAAILWGSVQALRQVRLKLLVAYSTVAQLGYLFLPFALAGSTAAFTAWRGAVYFILTHALAKAAMFLAAGNMLYFEGHDRFADLDRVAHRLPRTTAAFAIAGVSIIGLPPSGGFIAKWLLLEAALKSGQWWWALVIIVGGLLAAAYVFKVVGYAFIPAEIPQRAGTTVSRTMEWTALVLALGALMLGLVAPQPMLLMEVGAPFGASSGGDSP